MNPVYENLHREMLEEIKESQDTDIPELERATVGFWIANNYWDKLKQIVCSSVWEQEIYEIDFFRNVKPQFTGYIQYFAMMSEALLFTPECKEDQVSYWAEEMKRLDFFCGKHAEFVNYYKNGNQDMDKQYFKKVSEDWQHTSSMMTYDSDKKFCSTHDWLVRGLVAHTLFYDFANKRKKGL